MGHLGDIPFPLNSQDILPFFAPFAPLLQIHFLTTTISIFLLALLPSQLLHQIYFFPLLFQK